MIVDASLSAPDDYRRIVAAAPLPDGQPYELEMAGDGNAGGRLAREGAAAGRPFPVALVRRAEDLAAVQEGDPRIQIVLTIGDQGREGAALPDSVLCVEPALDPFGLRQAAVILARKWELERESEEGFFEVFNASPLPQSILALDKFEVIAVNEAYERILGFKAKDLKSVTPETFGRGLDAERWRGLMAKLIAKQPVDDHPFVYQPSAGVRRDMRCSARALRVRGRPCSIWVIRDVTDQMRLEDQARQTHKMDAIGQLAAGVAHDFNNLLTAILGFSEQAMRDTTDPKIRDLLEPVMATAQRAASLSRQLLIFGQKQALEIRPLDLSQVARDLKSVLRRLVSENIALVWEFPEALPPVMADVANIEQLIVNLVLNARDAAPAGNPTIRIGARLRHFRSPEDSGHLEGRAGQFVQLYVSDNGTGIAPETLSRIFEPFFTTKEAGKGTGMGLATVYSIARQHKGWVDVQTAPGKGSTFSIFQPSAEGPTVAMRGEASRRHENSPAHEKYGRVLAVDDDANVQAVLRLLFDRLGIDSVITTDAATALAIREESAPFNILITDIVMPNGMNGIELARTLRQRDPNLRIVLMTGYSPDLASAGALEMPGRRPRVLLKPFDLPGVLRALADA